MENGLSASDVALMSRDAGWGDSGFMWIFALLLLPTLMGGGAYGWGANRGYDGLVTEAGLCNANSFNELKSSVGRLSDANANYFMKTQDMIQNGLCNLGYETLRNFNTTQMEIIGGDNAIQRQLSECCCQNERTALENRYLAQQNTAEINAVTTAQTQKILDVISQNKIEALQSKVNALELQNAVSGVVRYPQATTYSVQSPCFNSGCGCSI